MRALDASGTSWGPPVTVDGATSNVGQYTSLAVINGNPAISYHDLSNGALKYVRALNASGTSWGTPPVTLDSTGTAGGYTSLAIVNGTPAISYYDATILDLKYVRALDASGTSWGTPVTLDSTGQVGAYTSLAVVAGNPAISYYDQTNLDLKYVRALDASGTSWGTPVTLDSTDFVGIYTSLAVVNGNPAISYYDLSNGDLKYVRALDAIGTSWGVPVTLDSTGDVGSFTSLAVVNGNPAVSYYDTTSGNLKWATYGSVATAPDIAVAQAGAVPDGGTVAFGTVTVGGSSAAFTFTLTNPGTADLTSLAVSGGTGEFSVSALSAMSIPVGAGTATFTVTFTPRATGARTATLQIASNVTGAKNPYDITLNGTGQTVFTAWTAFYGVANDPNVLGANGVKNLLNFAFGISPVTGTGADLQYAGTLAGGGTITATGLPRTWGEPSGNGVDFRALFVRRKNYAAEGVTYTPQFSADMNTWQNSAAVPAVLADDGVNQIVSVPYPVFIAGKKARFFRISVTLAP